MKKKIYIGDEITTPSWEEWVSFLSRCAINPFEIDKKPNFLGFSTHDSSQMKIRNAKADRFLYFPKKEAEDILNCEFINERRLEEEAQSEILFYSRENFASYGPLPIKLIKYSNGTLDLHRQTGSDFDRDINIAEGILKEMGLCLPTGKVEFIGPSGAYITVEKIKDKKEETR